MSCSARELFLIYCSKSTKLVLLRAAMRLSTPSHSNALCACLLLATFAVGDPNDWVTVDYVISQAKARSDGLHSSTADAQASIVHAADSSAQKGPWSIFQSQDLLPPSNNPHDYLSWAPYHWPNCGWCSSAQAGRTHLAHTVNSSRPENSDNNGNRSSSDPEPGDPYSDSEFAQKFFKPTNRDLLSIPTQTEIPVVPSNLPKKQATLSVSMSLPTSFTLPGPSTPQATTGSDGKSRGPAQAAAKTTKTSCTPSPTTSMAPSATWTTCPYISRDGQVNPDVRELTGPDAINAVAQSVLYNALAFALDKSSKYSKNVVAFIDTFFLNESTKMNPNVNFGQIVRGPGKSGRTGTFTGILDLRGIVKVVNGLSILKAANSTDWSQENDQALGSWFAEYASWLSSSDIGKKAQSRPNNHGTFYISQTASTKFLSGDQKGAVFDLQSFFSTTFLDQIAKSGEQPFEAVRSRPFHYRCFNLEAMITNAKLGDQLGIDLWTSKSRYGATIQTALDFLMSLNPGGEDISQLYPHVASISAAFGDPTGKYAAFLKTKDPTYQSRSYWFYDQTTAYGMAPASRKKTRSIAWKRENPFSILEDRVDDNADVPDIIPFECPAVFRDAVSVEIDDGIFVTCDDLRSFYG